MTCNWFIKPFIWIRCTGAGNHLKHAGQGVPTARTEKLWIRDFFFKNYGVGWQAIMYLSKVCVKPPHNSCQLTAALCKVQPDHNVTSVDKVGSSSLGGRRLKIGHHDVWIRGMTSGFSDHFQSRQLSWWILPYFSVDCVCSLLSSSSSKCPVSALLRNKYNFLWNI